MFDQTFVDETERSKKNYSVMLSLLLQIAGICLLVLLPLIYTQVLPSAQLRSELVSPPRPPVAQAVTAKRVVISNHRVFRADVLTAPTVIPKQISPASELAAAPAVGLGGSPTDQDNGRAGIPDSVFGAAAGPPPPALPKTKAEAQKGPVRIGSIQESSLIRKVMPVYPAAAKAARVQGVVEFTAIISKEGTIENLKLVHGHPLLVNAAREAVLQWKYRPTLLNGQPVEVITDIFVSFTLNQ